MRRHSVRVLQYVIIDASSLPLRKIEICNIIITFESTCENNITYTIVELLESITVYMI